MLVKRFWIAKRHPRLERKIISGRGRGCMYCVALGICDRLDAVCGELFYYSNLLDLCQSREYKMGKYMFAYVEEITENKEIERVNSIQV